MKVKFEYRLSLAKALLILSFLCAPVTLVAQEQRWFTIEVSVFTNESPTDRAEEQWQPERMNLAYPDKLRRLDQLMDLLMIDALRPIDPFLEDQVPADAGGNGNIDTQLQAIGAEPSPQELRQSQILGTGPFPSASTDSGNQTFRFFDFERQSYLQLPDSLSDFQQTNRVLERSSDHRLLWHGLWRQPVVSTEEATPIYVSGGLRYGDQHELQGSLTIRFNENQDRVVIDANVWLTEFSIVENTDQQWQLPPVPARMRTDDTSSDPALVYYPIQVYQMQQSRPMRSDEFHYVDHPAMGLVIQVHPYEVPDLPQPEFEFEFEETLQ